MNQPSTPRENGCASSACATRAAWRRWITAAAVTLALALPGIFSMPAAAETGPERADRALIKRLPGFANGYANVNGTRLHYVYGGEGTPIVLLPGWPETWWQYHKIMPALAETHRVIVIDLRGMGSSAKPTGGYDKKTMAKDIRELLVSLGYDKVGMAGHDIGAMVAFSFAANFPDATPKLALLDVPHPDEFFTQMPLLPQLGTFGDKIDAEHPGYPWWFAFHQVKGLPEQLVAGRQKIYLDWMFDYLTLDSNSISAADRAIYQAAYASRDALRAGDAWYQAFTQDVLDMKSYARLSMPVLGLGSTGYGWLKASLPPKAADFHLVKVENSGHFMAEEQPEFVAKALLLFFGTNEQ